MKKIYAICLLLLVYPAATLFAQKSSFGNWLQYFGNGKINDKWSTWTEVQYRSYNAISDREQLLARVALMYNLTPEANISTGYCFVAGKTYNAAGKATETTEHRIYQQLLLKQRFNRVYISHRYRIEERFLKDDFRLRLRYFLSTNIALNKKKLEKGTVYLSAYNEIFLYTDRPIFDRNRLYGGFGYVFNNSFKAEMGAMTQMQENKSRGQLNITLFHNFTW